MPNDTNPLTVHGELKKLIGDGELARAEIAWRSRESDALKTVEEVARRLGDQEQHRNQRRNERVEALAKEVFELQQQIRGLSLDAGNSLAQQNERLQWLLFKDEERCAALDDQLQGRRQELAKVSQELADTLSELAQLGKQRDLESIDKEAATLLAEWGY